MRTVIVGAGPTGAALAMLLARRGLQVVLIEKETDFGRVFRGEGLMPSGVAALRELAIGPGLDRVPQRIVDDIAYYADGAPLMAFEEPDRHNPDAIRVLSQEHLLAALVDAAREHPTFTFRPGLPVRTIARTERGFSVRCEEETFEADLLVGADGRASIVRAGADLALDRSRDSDPHNHDAVWCTLPLPPWLEERAIFYAFLGRDSVGTMYPTATGALRVGWLFPKGDPDARTRHPVDEVARLAPDHIAAWLRESRTEASEPVLFRVVMGMARRWSAPGVVLLGDAAHPMNAVRAQGINLGLRDAIVAANHLVPALTAGNRAALQRAGEAIEAERRPEIDEAQRLQLKIAAVPRPFFWPWFRRWVFSPLVRLGVPQRVQVRQERVLRYGLGDVSLTV